MTFMVVTGVKELDDRFQELGRKGMARVARSSIGKGLTVIKKAIQRAVPPMAKGAARGHTTEGVRKAIGTSMKVNPATDMQEAKVGAAVGKKRSAVLPRSGKPRPGVGISANNAHWYVLGTENRQSGFKTTRRRLGNRKKNARGKSVFVTTGYEYRTRRTGSPIVNRGRMPQQGAVKKGAAASMRQANDVIVDSIRTGIARENDRLKRGN